MHSRLHLVGTAAPAVTSAISENCPFQKRVPCTNLHYRRDVYKQLKSIVL